MSLPRHVRSLHVPQVTLAAMLLSALVLGAPPGPGAADAASQPSVPAALPLGTLKLNTGADPTCPPIFTCQRFAVRCPGTGSVDGFMATAPATATTVGVVVFYSGTLGTEYWSGESAMALSRLDALRGDGFEVIQVRWTAGWLVAPAGQTLGPALLACRPATVAKWIHDQVYVPLNLHPPLGACGYCLTGNSGGASQIAYALAFYGLDGLVNAAVPTSGPVHAALTKGCLLSPGYEYQRTQAQTIDKSYGYVSPPQGLGPCVTHDPSWTPVWNADSVDLGGTDYLYATTRIEIIIGGLDDSRAPAHAQDFDQALASAGTPYLKLTLVAQMGHQITNSVGGLNALQAALLGSVGTIPGPT